MGVATSNWVDIVTLVISFGTIILAWRVLVVNNKNADLDRRVHVADKRQDWINEVRHLVSEMLAQLKTLVDGNDDMPVNDYNRRAQSINYMFGKIKLMLNPDEPDCQKLVALIGQIISKGGRELDDNETTELLNQTVDLTGIILKKEWTRIKNLDG